MVMLKIVSKPEETLKIIGERKILYFFQICSKRNDSGWKRYVNIQITLKLHFKVIVSRTYENSPISVLASFKVFSFSSE